MGIRAAGLGVLLTLGSTAVATAAPGYLTGNVNLRAGPSTEYPVVITLPAGDYVEIFGCLSGYSWCDIDWNGYRGWVSSIYLESIYEDRRVEIIYAAPPIISFGFYDYWDTYYRDRPFYRYRDRYDRGDYIRDRRRAVRRAIRQDRREDRREVRQDRREERREVIRERRRDARRGVRQDRRREARQEARQERRRSATQDRRRQVRQDRLRNRRQDVRQERRRNARQDRPRNRQEVRQQRRRNASPVRRQERRAERRQRRQDGPRCRRPGAC